MLGAMKEFQGDIEEPKEGDWQRRMVKDAALLDFRLAQYRYEW